MKKRYRTILLVISGLIVLCLITWIYLFHKPQSSVASKKPDFRMQATALLSAFERDEAAANAKYLDKIIEVRGVVESKSSDSTGTMIYLKEADSISGVICSFTHESVNPDKVKKGSIVTIKGICTGYLMDVVLNKCSLQPDSSVQEDFQPQTSGFVKYLAQATIFKVIY